MYGQASAPPRSLSSRSIASSTGSAAPTCGQASRPNWLRNGGRYSGPRQYVDHRRYGLRAPHAGQRWVRYNNDYVLVTIASGLIASILAAK